MSEIQTTQRGFYISKFTDANGVECSVQESSAAADQGFIWLGCEDIGLKRFEPYVGWSDVKLEHNPPYGILHVANTRMHLTQDHVRDLLPILQHFVDHGTLPDPRQTDD